VDCPQLISNESSSDSTSNVPSSCLQPLRGHLNCRETVSLRFPLHRQHRRYPHVHICFVLFTTNKITLHNFFLFMFCLLVVLVRLSVRVYVTDWKDSSLKWSMNTCHLHTCSFDFFSNSCWVVCVYHVRHAADCRAMDNACWDVQ